MYTDLFLALLNRDNARGHPILSALVYVFCPTAARWWLVGADPIPPFDPVWKSLEDLTSGGTLLEFLAKYDLDNLTEEIRAYIHEVEEYRRQHPVDAPELMPTFRGGKIPVSRRYGSQNAIQHLGGDWRNLFIYVRTWAFLSQDWRISMQIERDSGYSLTGEKVCLTLPGYIGLFDIVTDPAFRNRGYGRRVVKNLLAWGRQNDAEKAYLQVMLNNAPALHLYSKIGFTEAYQYWYRIKP